MTLALTDDHQALADVGRSFLADRDALGAARAVIDGADGDRPPFWDELCALGWTGLHLPESDGGAGYGLLELAIVTEELGRTVCPGPFLATVLSSAVIAECGGPSARAVLAELASGARVAATALHGAVTVSGESATGVVHGVLSAVGADLVLLPAGADLVMVEAGSLTIEATAGMDPTRPLATVTAADAPIVATVAGGVAAALRIARVLAAAEATGGARACTEMAVAYAGERVQFGRTIGTFQAVKHHCANMAVAVELAGAATWDAARGATGDDAALAAAVAATRALRAYTFCAEKNIQLHGGIAYTWEHDAHLFLRRAAALAAVVAPDAAAIDVVRLSETGAAIGHRVELPEEAEDFRAEARAFRAHHDSLPAGERRAALVDSGYFMPHWPEPFGRGAGVVEQLVIEEELGEVEQPDLGIGTWVLLTLVQSCTSDQIDRWIRPALMGEARWCQLFSEPDAGSDAAAIKTRAVRVDGGWSVTGQKVWTSDAHNSTMGLATVRTDPDAPKHAGVTAMAIDMNAAGVEVRPLTELTGENLFNEVFLDEVFVPDDDVIGEVNQGWAVARATLGNERVSIGGNKGGLNLTAATELVDLLPGGVPDTLAGDVGEVLSEFHGMQSLNLRLVSRALAGGPPGPEGAITKLLSAEHAQHVGGIGMRLLGIAAVTDADAVAEKVAHTYLFSRCLTIAGGTSEIVRNVIAERVLGLPRDPLVK